MKIEFLKGRKSLRVDALGVAVVLAGAAAFYCLAVQPLLNRREQQSVQQSQLELQRKNAALMTARAEDLKRKLAQARADLAQCPVKLEPASAVNTRIGRLADLAAQNGLKVDEIQPAEPTYGQDYGCLPIHLIGSGGFRTWTAFLHQLSSAFPDTSVDGFQLSGKPDDPSAPMTFQVDLVWCVQPSAPSAPLIASGG